MIKLPTFVDLHTHTRYPDNSNFPSQDIEKAALNGGYSEILAMANSEIPIDSVENLKLAREIDQNLNIKVHRVASLTENLEGKKLINFSEFINEGIRIFSDDGKSLVDNQLAHIAFKTIAELDGAIFQHCEKNCHTNPGDIAPPNFSNELITIEEEEETEILERDLTLVEKYKTRYHAQHLSSKKSVELIRKAKDKGLPVTAEVTPHHLMSNNEKIHTSDGEYKMYPPIRAEDDRQALIMGLKTGVIDIIATDHAPHPQETKTLSFKNSARGVVGLESAFAVLYSSNIFTLEELIAFMSTKPKEILHKLGYDISENSYCNWLEGEDIFVTRSIYKNSLFENSKVKIQKDITHV